MLPLLDLPRELLTVVLRFLDHTDELVALSRSSRLLHHEAEASAKDFVLNFGAAQIRIGLSWIERIMRLYSQKDLRDSQEAYQGSSHVLFVGKSQMQDVHLRGEAGNVAFSLMRRFYS